MFKSLNTIYIYPKITKRTVIQLEAEYALYMGFLFARNLESVIVTSQQYCKQDEETDCFSRPLKLFYWSFLPVAWW